MLETKIKLDKRLPATPCTKEMRSDMDALAIYFGVGLADLQRHAIGLFLSRKDTKIILDSSRIEITNEGKNALKDAPNASNNTSAGLDSELEVEK